MKYTYTHILVGSVSLKNPDKSSLCVTASLLPGRASRAAPLRASLHVHPLMPSPG